METIATVSLTAGSAAAIEFDSIPSTYEHLLVVIHGRSTTATVSDSFTINLNSSSANFTNRYFFGTSSATNGATGTTLIGYVPGSSATASTFGMSQILFPRYSGSANKSITSESVVESNGASNVNQSMVATTWAVSTAISKITLATTASWAQHSTATLYGIKTGSGGAVIS